MWEQLAEARVKDWIQRGSPMPKDVTGYVPPSTLESQLLEEIIALKDAVRAEVDVQARGHLRDEADKRELQLMLLLETTGRPLVAKLLAERLASM